MSVYAKNFFYLNRFILYIVGSWPPDNKNKIVQFLYKVYATVFLYVAAIFIGTEVMSLFYTYKDEDAFIKNLGMTVTHLAGAMKAIFFYKNRDDIVEMIRILESEELSWFPFKTDTPGRYLIALVLQACCMLGLGYSIAGTDATFIGLMQCLAQNLVIIQGAFLTIRERSLKRIKGLALAADGLNNSECLNAAMNSEMGKVCRNLQTIFKLCWDLEKAYKYITLFQVLVTLVSLCGCLYLVSLEPLNSNPFYANITYLAAIGMQPFLYCWYGNEVTHKADEMSLSVYQCDWLAADIKFKRSVVFTMTRLKKPVYLTVGNFAPLSLATFVSVVKGSYSFFTFLTNTKK